MEELLTVPQIAARVKKSPRTIYSAIEKEEIPPALLLRIGGSIRMRSTDFDKWIEFSRMSSSGTK